MRRLAVVLAVVAASVSFLCLARRRPTRSVSSKTSRLAPDRSVPLKQLIPGTEDYYYYHALHYLNVEQFERIDELLTPWVQRHGETQRVFEIRMRQAMLTYDRDPEKSLAYLRDRLGVRFNHEKEVLGAEPNLPTAFDERRIARDDAHAARPCEHSHR